MSAAAHRSLDSGPEVQEAQHARQPNINKNKSFAQRNMTSVNTYVTMPTKQRVLENSENRIAECTKLEIATTSRKYTGFSILE